MSFVVPSTPEWKAIIEWATSNSKYTEIGIDAILVARGARPACMIERNNFPEVDDFYDVINILKVALHNYAETVHIHNDLYVMFLNRSTPLVPELARSLNAMDLNVIGSTLGYLTPFSKEGEERRETDGCISFHMEFRLHTMSINFHGQVIDVKYEKEARIAGIKLAERFQEALAFLGDVTVIPHFKRNLSDKAILDIVKRGWEGKEDAFKIADEIGNTLWNIVTESELGKMLSSDDQEMFDRVYDQYGNAICAMLIQDASYRVYFDTTDPEQVKEFNKYRRVMTDLEEHLMRCCIPLRHNK